MNNLVELENISFHYTDDREILYGINLHVKQDEILTIIGPNGCGKTTLIKILSGIQEVSGGKASFHPDLVVGYVPQKLNMDQYLKMSVDTFLKIMSNNRRSRFYQELLDKIGILHLKNQSLHNLSGGELQKVLLVQALARKPNLLIMDEPTSSMDIVAEDNFYKLINDIRKDCNCSVVISSHNLHMVMANSDRVICLNRHICCEGTPEEVSINSKFLDIFGNRYSTSIRKYHHKGHSE